MHDRVLPSEALTLAPRRQRAEGQITIAAVRRGAATRVQRIAEAGSSRVRLPRTHDATLEAVLINTGGGVACGDHFSIRADVGADADLVLTTPAAEKVYRSDGPIAEMNVQLSLGPKAGIAWLPQETILFDRARIRRRFEADLAVDARLSMFETVVFGRRARNEQVTQGLLEDHWLIRRDGRPIFADALRLSGPIADLLDRPAVADGARVLATFLHFEPEIESRLDSVRGILVDSTCLCGVSARRGVLAVRFLASEIFALRTEFRRFFAAFSGRSLPRVWSS